MSIKFKKDNIFRIPNLIRYKKDIFSYILMYLGVRGKICSHIIAGCRFGKKVKMLRLSFIWKKLYAVVHLKLEYKLDASIEKKLEQTKTTKGKKRDN